MFSKPISYRFSHSYDPRDYGIAVIFEVEVDNYVIAILYNFDRKKNENRRCHFLHA